MKTTSSTSILLALVASGAWAAPMPAPQGAAGDTLASDQAGSAMLDRRTVPVKWVVGSALGGALLDHLFFPSASAPLPADLADAKTPPPKDGKDKRSEGTLSRRSAVAEEDEEEAKRSLPLRFEHVGHGYHPTLEHEHESLSPRPASRAVLDLHHPEQGAVNLAKSVILDRRTVPNKEGVPGVSGGAGFDHLLFPSAPVGPRAVDMDEYARLISKMSTLPKAGVKDHVGGGGGGRRPFRRALSPEEDEGATPHPTPAATLWHVPDRSSSSSTSPSLPLHGPLSSDLGRIGIELGPDFDPHGPAPSFFDPPSHRAGSAHALSGRAVPSPSGAVEAVSNAAHAAEELETVPLLPAAPPRAGGRLVNAMPHLWHHPVPQRPRPVPPLLRAGVEAGQVISAATRRIPWKAVGVSTVLGGGFNHLVLEPSGFWDAS